MYAIISDGGFQYRVEEGMVLDIQRRDLDEGTKTIEFDRILFVGDLEDGPKVGTPAVDGAKVTASIVHEEIKGEKLVIQRFRRRKNHAVKKGHRQKYLRIKVDTIQA